MENPWTPMTTGSDVINELGSLDKVIPDKEVNRKLVSGLTKVWSMKRLVMEDMGKVADLPTSELISELKAYEYRQIAEKLSAGQALTSNMALSAEVSESSEMENMALLLKKTMSQMNKLSQDYHSGGPSGQPKRFARRSLVKSYTRSFNGFAANLTFQEKEKLASHEAVISIFPSRTLQLQTTRSWDFMGFAENVHRNPTVESDIIIGVLDTGIWPESKSFSDKGFSAPPKKWKGVCDGGINFTCNNKVIGARYHITNTIVEHEVTVRDMEGHGSHVASIAAGNIVKDTSFYGIAEGTARGGVPSARIAAYKVCSDEGCHTEDILAGFDDAIADGVDIISISVGTMEPLSLSDDMIAIGSLHATLKGILVVQSAGNGGFFKEPVMSTAPWIFTVAASTTDRGIVSKVALGNGTTLLGKAVNYSKLNGTNFPVVYGKHASSECDEDLALYCDNACLDSNLVKGKIVLCVDGHTGIGGALRRGAVGTIALCDDTVNVSDIVPFPSSCLNEQDFSMVKNYVHKTELPKADILISESISNLDAPRVANFSSRGPNIIIPDILKPDITAPGVEILAAFSPAVLGITYKRSVNYIILSGTSMSCPHVAGAAAYVKSFHPDWSPSAIKSALMTTAWRMNATEDPYAEFSYGSGHIDPVRAANPGLVYETLAEDITKMICSLGNDTTTVRKIFGVNCTDGVKLPKDVNYPSMATRITTTKGNMSNMFTQKFTRTVTNVGLSNSTYAAITSKSSDYNISVIPCTLTFGSLNEKKSFDLVISGKIKGKMISASIEWSDGVHVVRSPIVVYPDYF